jgi:hypothetical protein
LLIIVAGGSMFLVSISITLKRIEEMKIYTCNNLM